MVNNTKVDDKLQIILFEDSKQVVDELLEDFPEINFICLESEFATPD